MTKIGKSVLVDFGKKYSTVTSGHYIPDEQTLLSGHSDGSVVMWNLKEKRGSTLIRISGHRISSISLSPSGLVLVGSATGAAVVFPLKDASKFEYITQPTHRKTDRVWRVAWASDKVFYMGMNYGSLRRVSKSNTHWSLNSIHGHSNAIFGLNASNELYVAAGDYRGNVSIRRVDSDQIYQLTNVGSGVQGAAWLGEKRLAVITKQMGIQYFEQETSPDKLVFRRTCTVDLGDGIGSCVALSHDGRMVYGGTSREIIIFDIEKYVGRTISSNPCVRMWPIGDALHVLTENEFTKYKVGEIDYPSGLVSSKRVKVSLLGHTGAGKTTLCERLIKGEVSKVKSTFGKRIWRWNPDDTKGTIIFYDHGGQEAVIGTFIPFLEDSDIVLVVFKRTEYVSFENALKVLKELEESISKDTPIVMVETHRDDMDATMAESTFQPMVEDGTIAGYFSVSSTEGEGIQELSQALMSKIRWKDARIVFETETSSQVRELVENLRESGISTLTVYKLATKYRKQYSKAIPEHHLRFILRGLSIEGLLSYYPEILDVVIINDDEFNQLWSKMPLLAKSKGGIVTLKEIRATFPELKKYVNLIDAIFVTHEICLEFGKLKVFPESLPSKGLILEADMKHFLRVGKTEERWVFRTSDKVQRAFFKGFLDMNLIFHGATQTEGLFSWKTNGVLYYRLEYLETPFEEKLLVVNWRVGGQKAEVIKRLSLRFQKLMEQILSDPIETPLLKVIRDREKYNAEFKSSFRWDYDKSCVNNDLEYEVVRAMVGMMNAEAGKVLIGVSDDGDILGLDNDYKQLGKKKNWDVFELRLLDVIDKYVGRGCAEWYSIDSAEVQGREVCVIDVKAAPHEVFLKMRPRKQKDIHFVARIGNSTRELNMDEFVVYKKDHWGK